MTDKLRDAAQQALDDDLLVGQAQHLISALMNRGFLPNNLPTAEYITLWDVVKRQLMCVNKEGARAALAQQDAQCGLCGADRPFTGSCGGGRENPRALCFADRVPLAQQDAQAMDHIPDAREMVSPTYGSEEIRKLRETIQSMARIIRDYEAALTPPAQRVMLTDEEIEQASVKGDGTHSGFARAVIEAYERKNEQPKTLPAPLEQQGNPYPSR